MKTKKTIRSLVMLIALTITGVNYSNAQWQQTNGPYGAIVNCLAISGTNIFAGTNNGVYLSTNNGAHWTAVNNGIPNGCDVNAIATNGSNIFASNGNEVYFSTNNGASWTACGMGITDGITTLAVNGSNIFAGTNFAGIFLSVDNGQSWNAVNNGIPFFVGTDYGSITTIVINGSDIYVGIDQGGVFLSTNNGASWSCIGFSGDHVTSIATNGANVFIAIIMDGVYYTNNNGTNWTPLNNGLSGVSEINALAVDGTNIYAGTHADGMYFSADFGATWNLMLNGLPMVYCKSIVINGSNIFAATDGCGVFLSSNNGANWSPVNDGILLTNVSSMAVSGSTIFAGTEVNGIFMSSNNGLSWTMMNNAITETTFHTLIVNGPNIYAGCLYDIFLSSNNGSNWTKILNNGGQALAVNGNNIYVGDQVGVHVSTDNGATWNYYTNGFPGICYIRAIGISGTNVFAGSMDQGLYVSTDNGVNWSLANGSIHDQIFSIAANGNNIYVATENGLFISPDNGVNWSAVGNGFPSGTNVNTVIFIGANIFAGTGQGVYMSTNNGASWVEVNTGLLNTGVRSLTFDGINVYAGTNGGGVWKRALSDFNVISSSFSGNVFNDINNNGIKDNNETGLPNVLIKTKANNWVFNSDMNGNFTAYSNLLNDTISIVNPSYYSTVNPANYTVTDGDIGKNFAVHFIPNINDLRVTVTNLTPARPGFDDKIRITYANKGTATMSGNVTLDYDNSLTYLSSSPAQSSMNSNTISWNYSNLIPLEKRNIDALFNIPANVQTGTVLHFSGTIYPVVGDTFPVNNYNSIEQDVKGSFDPNEKEVIPGNGFTPQQLASDEKLVFTIHFQNTGSDTAFNIKVVDTLSAKLDATTFEILSSSHPCTFTIRGAGIVEFTFSDILLPDSNVNLSGSNGFVKYAVKPKSNLLLGDNITNTAYIYFDYNQPIATNTTNTLIQIETGLVNNLVEDKGIMIYPIPASTILSIKYKVQSTKTVGSYMIYDNIGQMIINRPFSGKEFQINISSLTKGLYFLKVEDEEGIGVRKFIKE